MKTHQLFLSALAMMLGAIIFGQCQREKLKANTFTVYPNHREAFTVKCHYRGMEVYWGDDFILESNDTGKIVSFVLVGLKDGIGGMVQKDSCVFFSRDSMVLAGEMANLIKGGACNSNVEL